MSLKPHLKKKKNNMGKVPKFLQTGSGEEQKGQLLLQTSQNTPTEVKLDSNVLCFYFFFGRKKSSIWNSTRLHRVCTGQHFDLSYLKKATCVTMEMVANNSGFPPTSQHTNTPSGDGSPVSFLSFPGLLKRATVSSWSSLPG